MSGDPHKMNFLKRWWFSKSETERKRIKSFIPLVMYTVGFAYFVIYLSILNSVNRHKSGATVKSWFGGDAPEIVRMKEKQQKEIEESFKALRKRVSGNR